MPRYINDIIIHCSATRKGLDIGATEIDKWHQDRGYRKIGYHYVVRLDGTIERGRAISQPGAHCYGHNAHSIGICYVGGLDGDGKPADTRTQEQKAALLKIITRLTLLYKCRTHGHHFYNAGKACPCFDCETEYGGIYAQCVGLKC